MEISYQELTEANGQYVAISNEPFSVNVSVLDFAVKEYEHSRKRKWDVALLIFRINVNHAFAQGNKRICFYIAQKYGIRDELTLYSAITHIAEKADSISKEQAIHALMETLR